MQSLKSSNIKERANSFAWSETHQLLPSIQAKVMKRQAAVHFSTLLLPWSWDHQYWPQSLKHNRDYCHSKFESSWLHIVWWQKKRERQCISFWLCMDSIPGIYITMDFNGFSSCRRQIFLKNPYKTDLECSQDVCADITEVLQPFPQSICCCNIWNSKHSDQAELIVIVLKICLTDKIHLLKHACFRNSPASKSETWHTTSRPAE